MVVFAGSRVGDGVFRQAFEPMLADDDRPLFIWLQVFWQQKNALGEHVRIKVEGDFGMEIESRESVAYGDEIIAFNIGEV